MMKIKQKVGLVLPRISGFWPHRVRLSPPEPENDELIEAIATDMSTHDDNWQLSERPDSNQLTEYWSEVQNDIAHDPEWQKISESDV